MQYVTTIKDTVKEKTETVKTLNEATRFMVMQTANLLITNHLTTEELTELQRLLHNEGEITLLYERFIVTTRSVDT